MSESLSEQLRLLASARGELVRVGQTIEEISLVLTELSLSVKTIQRQILEAGSKNWLEKSLMQAQEGESLYTSGRVYQIRTNNTSQ